MNNKETKYNNIKITPNYILTIVIYILILCGIGYGIIKEYKTQNFETDMFNLFVLTTLICSFISIFIGNVIGKIKGKNYIRKENKIIKQTNPYIYYRELPNNYGIGVATLLFDSEIENYKDIVAVILDLCAKKNLSLNKVNDKYYIKVLKNADKDLLNNELYIYNLIVSNNIKNIDYSVWFNYCLQDGNSLGLYYHDDKTNQTITEEDNYKDISKKLNKIYIIICIFISIFIFIYGLFAEKLIEGLIISSIVFIVLYLLKIPINYIGAFICALKNSTKSQITASYNNTLVNHLTRTEKGIIELQKLISFKNFLSDFGNFVNKNPEEVILWDRYLSYAQVFGLTEEIMKTDYKKLIDNSSFQIDDINNITLNNIEKL